MLGLLWIYHLAMLNDRIKKLRLSRGLTLQQVGDHFGITAASVANWENGKSQPDSRKLSRLALLFNCSITFLLEGVSAVPSTDHSSEFKSVPFVPWAQIGKTIVSNKSQSYVSPIHNELGSKGFATRYSGGLDADWTQGPIPAGALIFVDPETFLQSDCLVLIEDLYSNHYFAKVLKQMRTSEFFIEPISYKKNILSINEVKIVGRVVEWRISGVL